MASGGRFRSTVAHDLRGRPPYAARLIRRLAELTGVGQEHGLLDLGCGDVASLLDRARSMSSTASAKLGPRIEDLRQEIAVRPRTSRRQAA